ncbi:MAG: lysophospholipid acyltransferase family protein [Actinomycetales bacterium]
MLYRTTELIGYPALRGWFRPQVTGRDLVPREGAAIVAANHLSAADQVVTPISARRQVLYFAKAEYFEAPGVRNRVRARVFRELGHIPVDRDDARAAASTITIGAELLEEGKVLGIFPEGTRSPDGRLHKFRTGVARLALRSGAPVVPVGLVGTDQMLRPGTHRWRRAHVEVHFGAPLDFSGRAEDERSSRVLREVTEVIRQAVQRLSGQEYDDTYAR